MCDRVRIVCRKTSPPTLLDAVVKLVRSLTLHKLLLKSPSLHDQLLLLLSHKWATPSVKMKALPVTLPRKHRARKIARPRQKEEATTIDLHFFSHAFPFQKHKYRQHFVGQDVGRQHSGGVASVAPWVCFGQPKPSSNLSVLFCGERERLF